MIDWTGVAIILQKAAKDYEALRDGALAADKIVDLERAELAMQASLVAATSNRDAIITEAAALTEAWRLQERELTVSFESRKARLESQLRAIQDQITQADRLSSSRENELVRRFELKGAELQQEFNKRRDALAAEIARLEGQRRALDQAFEDIQAKFTK